MANLDNVQKLKEILDLMIETISSAGPTGIPSGHFYAQLMPYMSINMYQKLTEILVKSGRISIDSHVLRAVA